MKCFARNQRYQLRRKHLCEKLSGLLKLASEVGACPYFDIAGTKKPYWQMLTNFNYSSDQATYDPENHTACSLKRHGYFARPTRKDLRDIAQR